MNKEKQKTLLRMSLPDFIRELPKKQAIELLRLMRKISSPLGQEVIDEEIKRRESPIAEEPQP